MKFAITDFYAKKLPNGQMFPPKNRQNPGLGQYVPDPDGLRRLVENHRENMLPFQMVAAFILQHIHKLALPTPVPDLFLTKHHGVPVADDCNGADIEVSSSEGDK